MDKNEKSSVEQITKIKKRSSETLNKEIKTVVVRTFWKQRCIKFACNDSNPFFPSICWLVEGTSPFDCDLERNCVAMRIWDLSIDINQNWEHILDFRTYAESFLWRTGWIKEVCFYRETWVWLTKILREKRKFWNQRTIKRRIWGKKKRFFFHSVTLLQS